MGLDVRRIPTLANEWADKKPSEIIAVAIKEYGPDIAISFSGAEDVVLVDMACKAGGKFKVFSLDTGRLHPETYQFLEKVRERYKIPIETYFPQPEAVQKLVAAKGLYSFYRDGHKECCGVRKVEPLQRALADLDAWISGLRPEQSVTRSEVTAVEIDQVHEGRVKLNPLAKWNKDDVWAYVRKHAVPVNALHAKGYPSVGCAPCSRAIREGEDDRAGRWWWEQPENRECGIHTGYEEKGSGI